MRIEREGGGRFTKGGFLSIPPFFLQALPSLIWPGQHQASCSQHGLSSLP